MTLREILATPWIAAVLGFVIGAALIGAAAWSRNISTSPDKRDSIAVMMMFMMGGMLVATGVLLAYVFIAPQGFLWFGLSLSAGFVIGLAVAGIRLMLESNRD